MFSQRLLEKCILNINWAFPYVPISKIQLTLLLSILSLFALTMFSVPIKSYAQNFYDDRFYRFGFQWGHIFVNEGSMSHVTSGSGIDLDSKGNVYLLDIENSWILKYNGKPRPPDNLVDATIRSICKDFTAFTVDTTDTLYVVNVGHRVHHTSSEIHCPSNDKSSIIRYIPIADGWFRSERIVDTDFIFPTGIAVDNQGTVYVADPGSDTLYKFDSITSPPLKTHIKDVWDVAVNGDFVYAVSSLYFPGANQILKFYRSIPGSNLSFSSSWGNSGSAVGQFLCPESIDMDNNPSFLPSIYIADPCTGRVQKFSSDGNLEAYWSTRVPINPINSINRDPLDPISIAVHPNGDFAYVSGNLLGGNREEGNVGGRVQEYNAFVPIQNWCPWWLCG